MKNAVACLQKDCSFHLPPFFQSFLAPHAPDFKLSFPLFLNFMHRNDVRRDLTQ